VSQSPLPPVYSIYASFWRRAVGFLIDVTLLNLILWVIQLLTGLEFIQFTVENTPQIMGPGAGNIEDLKINYNINYSLTTLGHIAFAVLWLAYFGIMEGGKQATIGKSIVGATVSELDGSPITYRRALWRNVTKMLSVLTIIGFAMAAFTSRRQALHDMLARTVVLDQKSKGRTPWGAK